MQYEFIESSIFTQMVHDYLSEEDYVAFQQFWLEHPDAGDEVRGLGGVLKVRWARVGAGKSGGVRVCYYTRNQRGQILLLVIYAKSVRASIPGALLKQIKEVLDHDDRCTTEKTRRRSQHWAGAIGNCTRNGGWSPGSQDNF